MAQIQYHNPAGLLVGSVILWFLATGAVALRFYSRRWKHQKYITSDWLMLVTCVFGTGLTVLEIYAIATKALGSPIGGSLEDPAAVSELLNRSKAVEFSFLALGILGIGMLKLSVCFLYWELFGQLLFRRLLIVWITVIVLWTAAFFIVLFSECGSHFLKLWGTVEDYSKYCGVSIPSGWAWAGTDAGTDLVTLLIPIPVVLKLNMARHVKVLTLLTFSIGVLSVAASSVKAWIYISATLNRYSDDAILTLTGVSIWNLAEIQVGTIAACGPTLRAILVHITPTQSVASLLTSWRQPSRRSESEQSSTYVKMGGSAEGLGKGGRDSTKGHSDVERGGSGRKVENYELQTQESDI